MYKCGSPFTLIAEHSSVKKIDRRAELPLSESSALLSATEEYQVRVRELTLHERKNQTFRCIGL